MLAKYERAAGRLRAEYEHAVAAVADEKQAAADADAAAADWETARGIVQEIAAGVQASAHAKIAGVVSRCLEAVFPGAYEFKIEFEKKRGRTQARLLFTRGPLTVEPLDAAGGGAVDVAAFALRVAALILSRPPRRRLLVLDEPFAHCKPPEIAGPRICRLIEMLAQEFEIQFIIIPSIEAHYKIGRVVSI